MNKLIHSFVFRGLVASLLSLLSFSAWAGSVGTITYGPVVASTPVPTMSGVMLVMLALLLATIAYRILRQKENNAGRMMVLSLLAVGALASGLGGITLIDDAYAPSGIPLTNPGGDTLLLYSGTTSYINDTGAVTEILGRTAVQGCAFQSIIEECTIGKQLAADEICNLALFCNG